MGDKLLTLAELADRWSVSVTTIRRLVWRSYLPSVKIGGQVRIRERDAEAYVTAHEEPAKAPLQSGRLKAVR